MTERDDSKKTCAEQISERMESRLNYLFPGIEDMECHELLEFADSEGYHYRAPRSSGDPDLLVDDIEETRQEIFEAHEERLFQDLLACDKLTTYRLLFSTGGPEDYIELTFDKEGDLISGSYHFKDWFDGASRPLDIETAERVAELYCIDPKNER